MDKIRAKINGEYVYGWYVQNMLSEHHFIVPDASFFSTDGVLGHKREWRISNVVEFDPANAAVDTGRDDKNKRRIFGSKGVFQGGDRVRASSNSRGAVTWSQIKSGWCVFSNVLGEWATNELEIIPKEEDQ